jgi:hypothetical protein
VKVKYPNTSKIKGKKKKEKAKPVLVMGSFL